METKKIKMVIPKGKLFDSVVKLLNEAGFNISDNGRDYRLRSVFPWLEIKILKPQNIPSLVGLGKQDLGFAGYDWICESRADVEELLDLGFKPVKVVAALPVGFKKDLKKERIVVASEYLNLTKDFLKKEGIDAVFIKSYGSTEVFPPDDADMVIDNTVTGTTLKQNNLEVYKEILKSSTRFIANKEALKDSWKRKMISEIKTTVESVLLAREKVLLEMNVSDKDFPELVKVVPCMRSPTVNKLYEGGYAIKVAVPKKDVPKIIPVLKEKGATDILEYTINKIVL